MLLWLPVCSLLRSDGSGESVNVLVQAPPLLKRERGVASSDDLERTGVQASDGLWRVPVRNRRVPVDLSTVNYLAF